jgi:isocitrate dehydrogenase (NAD+)
MLDHVGHEDRATRLRAAVSAVLNEDKVLTRDLGGTASTHDFSGAVIARLQDR